MRNKFFIFGKIATLAIAIATTLVACKDKEEPQAPPTPPTPPSGEATFNVLYRVGHDRAADWSLQPFSEAGIKVGEISFQGKGYNLGSTRTQQVFSSHNGSVVYVYDQGTGELSKLKPAVGSTEVYTKIGKIDTKAALDNGTGNIRLIDNNTAVLYRIISNVTTATVNGEINTTVTSTAVIAKVDLQNLAVNAAETKKFNLPVATTSSTILYVSGLGAPILANGKLYFGVAKDEVFRNSGKRTTYSNYPATSLVVNYPAFDGANLPTNGNTNGATARPSHIYGLSYGVYNNSLYHTTIDGKVLKITNDSYDSSYVLDLATAAGITESITVTGFFYVNNGIAYTNYSPVNDKGRAVGYDNAASGVLRIDLNAKTAVKLNVPAKLWLNFYQAAKVHNGKLYMALCPTDTKGNIYIFDPTKTDANGFEKGAALEALGGALYLGVF